MFEQRERINKFIYRFFDIIIVGLSFILAFQIRKNLSFPFLQPFDEKYENFLLYFPIILIILWYLLYLNKVYVSYRKYPVKYVIFNLLKANLQGFLLVGFILFFLKEYWISRTLIFIFFLTCCTLLIIGKIILFSFLRYTWKINKNIKNALIIGTGHKGRYLVKKFLSHPNAGFQIIGFVGNNMEEVGKDIEGVPILGLTKDLQKILHQNSIDEVFITMSSHFFKEIQIILLECEHIGINAKVLVSPYKPLAKHIYIEDFFSLSFISYSEQPEKIYKLVIKNIFDKIISLTLIPVLLPIMLLISVIVKLDSKGPIIFKQERAGLNGRKFIIYKFRSMFEDAPSKRYELEELNEIPGPVFKIKDDPRITGIGRFIRRTSLDELPQFLNVLKGDMSLIGPRPLFIYESDKICGFARRRFSMKPGITGLWQISGRSEINFEKWMELDLNYIDNYSFYLDLKILLKTPIALFSKKGAY